MDGMRSRATQALSKRRLHELAQLLLEQPRLSIFHYVREKESEPGSLWFIDGGQPLTLSQVYRYIQRAEKMLGERFGRDLQGAVSTHLGRLERLYREAVLDGDKRLALSALNSQRESLKLLGAFPREEVASHGPVTINIFERANILAGQLAGGQPRGLDGRVPAGPLLGDGGREPFHPPDADAQADGISACG
jgi:hypothetical protein